MRTSSTKNWWFHVEVRVYWPRREKGIVMTNDTKFQIAELRVDGKIITLPILEDTAGFRALDIRGLWKDARCYTYDPGFGCTVSCQSAISHVDGEKGQLLYRGYPV